MRNSNSLHMLARFILRVGGKMGRLHREEAGPLHADLCDTEHASEALKRADLATTCYIGARCW